MLDEEIKKSRSNKSSPFTPTSTHEIEDSSLGEKLSELNLKSSHPSFVKQRTPTRPPIPINKGGRGGTSLPGDSFFLSQSMPIRPVIGSLPGPTICEEMPPINLPPSTSFNSPPGVSTSIKNKDDQEEFMPRSLIKHTDGFHIPLKQSFIYAASCPSNIANFPVDIIEKMADAEAEGNIIDDDEPLTGTSVTAFSLLESGNVGKSPPDDLLLSRMRTSSARTKSFDINDHGMLSFL